MSKVKSCLVYFLCSFFVACSSLTDQPILRLNLEHEHLLANYSLLKDPHNLQLTQHKEAGVPLVIIGKLLRAENESPIPNQEIIVYQADHHGNYEESVAGDETTARIRGSLSTDKEGRFRIKTILPGDYGTQGGAHIHMIIKGAQPEGYDFYFRQFMSSGLIYWAKFETDQAVVIRLHKDKMGRLIGIKDIVVKGFINRGIED